MPLGLQFGQAPNRPASAYQGQSEGYLDAAGNAYSSMLGAGRNLTEMGQGLSSLWSSTFKPMVSQLAGQASYNPHLENQAGIDTQKQFENARGQMVRNATRMGINPNSGRFAGLEQQWGQALAAAKAGAMTRAARDERAGQFSRLAQVLGYGNPVLGAAQGALGSAANIAQGAAGGLHQVAGSYGDIAFETGANASLQELRRPNQAMIDAEARNAEWIAGRSGGAQPERPIRTDGLSYGWNRPLPMRIR